MPKFLRSPLALPLALLSLATVLPALSFQKSALAQEVQGCFVIDSWGQVFDLSRLCPTSSTNTNTATSQSLGTGDIQVTLRWSTTDDLDLSVSDPGGQMVDFATRTIPSGGELDVDANANCTRVTANPVENVFWPTNQAPQGDYLITVNLYSRCTQASGRIPFTVTLLVQGTTQSLTGFVDEANPTWTNAFSLPNR